MIHNLKACVEKSKQTVERNFFSKMLMKTNNHQGTYKKEDVV